MIIESNLIKRFFNLNMSAQVFKLVSKSVIDEISMMVELYAEEQEIAVQITFF